MGWLSWPSSSSPNCWDPRLDGVNSSKGTWAEVTKEWRKGVEAAKRILGFIIVSLICLILLQFSIIVTIIMHKQFCLQTHIFYADSSETISFILKYMLDTCHWKLRHWNQNQQEVLSLVKILSWREYLCLQKLFFIQLSLFSLSSKCK